MKELLCNNEVVASILLGIVSVAGLVIAAILVIAAVVCLCWGVGKLLDKIPKNPVKDKVTKSTNVLSTWVSRAVLIIAAVLMFCLIIYGIGHDVWNDLACAAAEVPLE